MDRADRPFLAAVVQMSSTSSEEGNWRQVKSLVEHAAQLGAQLVVTPENTNYLGPHEEKVRRAEPLGGPTCAKFAHLADELDIHLLLGSFNERGSQPGRCRNTSVLFGQEGEILAVYRKIHLFDVDVADAVRFLESATVEPGGEVVVAETPLGKIGLSICYDLRFGELYRKLVDGGAEMIAIPPPSPPSPARRTGSRSSAPGRSRASATSSLPHSAASTTTTACARATGTR